MGVSFVDSNIFLYAFLQQDSLKNKKAKELVSNSNIVISTQVINEVSVNLMRKAKFTESQIQHLIESFYQKYQVLDINQDVLLVASNLRQRYNFSFWDGMVVASALLANAKILYSEDMQAGLIIDNSLEIVQPF